MTLHSKFDLGSFRSNLCFGEDGIFYALAEEAISYPEERNEACFGVEDKSFWFRHRNDCILELIKKHPPAGGGPILDVGAGNGFVAKAIFDAGWQAILVEPGQAWVINAKKRSVENIICATVESAGFQKNSIPVIGVFDVVEHIEDDIAFLKHLHDLLEPGGMLYLTVPAVPGAWSDEDAYAGHFRRYTRRTLSMALRGPGLETKFMTSIFSWLLLPVFLLRAVPYRLRGGKAKSPAGNTIQSDHSLPAAIAPIANTANRWELKRLSRRKSVPVGSSLLCAAQKN